MYVLDGILFPFEIFAENFDEEDKIYQVLSKIDCSPIEKHFGYKGCGRRGAKKAALFRVLVLKNYWVLLLQSRWSPACRILRNWHTGVVLNYPALKPK